MTLRRLRGRCRSTFRSVRSPLRKRHQVATILHLSQCRPFVWIDFTLPLQSAGRDRPQGHYRPIRGLRRLSRRGGGFA